MENELLKKLNTLNEKSSIKDIQEYANKMIEERGFEDETPQDILMLLTEELGELAKEVRKSTSVKIDDGSFSCHYTNNIVSSLFLHF